MAVTKQAITDSQTKARNAVVDRRLSALEAARRRQGVAGGATTGGANATKIQGVGVSATAPTDGQVLEYDAGSGVYAPTTLSEPVTVRFMIGDGSIGTNVALNDAAEVAGSVSKCSVIVTASDAADGLTFKIKQNGVDVFSADPTIAAGAVAGSKVTFTNLTSSPLAVAAGNIFTMDITSGSSDWKFIAKLE